MALDRGVQSRRQLLRNGLAITGLALASACGVIPPTPQASRKIPRVGYLTLSPARNAAWNGDMTENYPITISTYDELLNHEQELLERISALPNGGQLYLIHPLRVLAEVGAELAPDVQDEFAAQHDGSGGWSEEPYRALRESTSAQLGRVTLRGLFRRSS